MTLRRLSLLCVLTAAGVFAQPRVPVLIVLHHQPQRAVVDRVTASRAVELDLLEAARHHIRQRLWRNPAEPAAAQRALDDLTVSVRRQARREIEQLIEPAQRALEDWLRGNGATAIERFQFSNLVTAELPAPLLDTLRSFPDVAAVHPVEYLYPQLATSVPALGADTFWTNGFTGAGESVAVLDSGVQTNHPAFASLNTVSRTFLSYGSSQDECFAESFPLTASDLQGHGTHVAGIIASQGAGAYASFRGVARGISTLYNLKIAYLTQAPCSPGGARSDSRDVLAAINYLATETPVRVVNYSYGGSNGGLGDNFFARAFDSAADVFGLSFVIAAGNSGPAAGSIASPAIAYNALAVANWSSRGAINNSSSRGPVPDGRFKPDIAAPGTAIFSTSHSWESGSWFRGATGTSMAAPHIAGAVALLRSAGASHPLAIKALLLNTTDNTGWASDRGWGYSSLTRLWSQRHWRMGSLRAAGQPGSYHLYRISPSAPLRATVVWNRHITGSAAAFNDIDLHVFQEASGALLAASESAIQNVEQVALSSTSPLILKVLMFSTPLAGGIDIEPYALALSEAGATPVDPPALSVSCQPPPVLVPAQSFSLSCSVTNSGGVPAFNVAASLALPPGFAAAGGIQFGQVPAGTTVGPIASAPITAGAAGIHSLTVNLSATSFGEPLQAATSTTITVTSLPPAIPVSPSPAHLSASVPLPVTLSWAPAAGAASYDVYFGTATNPPFVGATVLTSFPLPALSPATTYYWRVVAKNAAASASSPVWQFTTQAPGLANDSAAAATLLNALPSTTHQDVRQATDDPADPIHSCTGQRDRATVWFRYLAASSAPLEISTAGSDYPTVLAVYSALPATADNEVACASSPQSTLTVAAVAGRAYWFQVAAAGTSPAGNLTFTVRHLSNPRKPAIVYRNEYRAMVAAAVDSDRAVSGGGVFASAPAADQTPAGDMLVAARDEWGGIWAAAFQPASLTWRSWQPGGGQFVGDPALVYAPAAGFAWVAARDRWNGYWVNTYSPAAGFSSWRQLGGVFASDPVVAATSDGSLVLIGKDYFHGLWYQRVSPAGVASGWTFLGGVVQGKPDAATGADGAVYLALRDPSQSLWVARLHAGSPTDWFHAGGVLATDPKIAATRGGMLCITALDAGSSVWYRQRAEGRLASWQPWQRPNGLLASLAVASAGADIWLVGRDHRSQLWWFSLADGQWSPAAIPPAAGAPAATPR